LGNFIGEAHLNFQVLPVTVAASTDPVQPQCQGEQDFSQMPAVASIIAIGIVIFNNAAAELSDLARSLHRAIARLADSNSLSDPPRSTVVSIHLMNNGDRQVDASPFGPRAKLTHSPVNLGFGRAHNQLMAEAFSDAVGAEYYLALNPDGMLHPDALVEMIAVACRSEGGALVEAAQFPEELSKSFDPLTLDTPWASGCCLLIPAAIYAAICGFDDNIFLYCEDVDLSWRARQAGFAVKHAPRALFHHWVNRPGINHATRRAHLESARYLAKKWGREGFMREVERQMTGQGFEPKALPAAAPLPAGPSVADFDHGMSFASERWVWIGAIPVYNVARHAAIDNTVDVVVRFHDLLQINRLSRCLFSLFGQLHQPIQVLLMLQGLDDADVAAVEACVDAFDWSAPRRRPIVTNVSVPPTGDHRARLWNAGLDAGGARYLGFCDFDDIVYSAGYGYLLHRLHNTGAVAVFASALHVDCTPMAGFDYAFAKRFLPGRDRYDFFVGSFCPPNCILLDRSRISPADLHADESLSKNEDYRVFAKVVAKYDTDWASIGTAVAEYVHRTDGSNTVLSHRGDAAGRRDWDQSIEATRQYLATLTATVPVGDIAQMRRRLTELEITVADESGKRAQMERSLSQMERSLSWRLTRPVREVERVVRRLRKRRSRRD
jgi:GT2 family glycosyltransferase